MYAFLIGFGIYLGFVWTNNLDESASSSDSRAIFITYLISFVTCYSLYALSNTVAITQSKDSNDAFLEQMTRELDQSRNGSIPLPGLPFQTSMSRLGPFAPMPTYRAWGEPSPDIIPNGDPLQVFREAANLRRELAALDDRIAQVLERLGNP